MTNPSGSKRLLKGDILFKEGDVSNAMYLIRSGSIRIFKRKGDSQIEIDTLRAGQILGEMAFLDGNPRSASAEALHDAELVEISKSIYDSTMVQIPEWLKVLLKAIVARLRSTTTKMKNLETSSSEMNYAEGRRTFTFLSIHDSLKIASAVLLVGAQAKEEKTDGKKIKLQSLERYSNQVMGIPLAKVTGFIDVLKHSAVLTAAENAQEFWLKDTALLEMFVQYVCDENLLEPTKRHDIGIRAFLVMGLIAKHLEEFSKDDATGLATVNLSAVKKIESAAAGKEAFRFEDLEDLVRVGYASALKVQSADEQTTTLQAASFKKIYRIQMIMKTIEAVNEEKQKAALGYK